MEKLITIKMTGTQGFLKEGMIRELPEQTAEMLIAENKAVKLSEDKEFGSEVEDSDTTATKSKTKGDK